ncbi:protein FAR1-RELATED SEQUENCE 5-like [Phragmites australis]|uniref:protein FAR1-RELATED SEQUENCE 5-like n=1 Tax=Phragmites australis TaxID=29695 RepID=UPI002D7759A7|nr:protein FAR1-RELATED SEQUENCE 5-like [Phragmites australis]
MPTGALDGTPNGGVAGAGPSGELGEVQGVLEHLRKRQAESPGFFYAMQVDGGNRVTGVFWADARARAAYGSFGDAVTLDTTYQKTRYMPPVAVFQGVNHHLQGVTLGCCLLMDETKASYLWLLDTWLAAMGGGRRHPGLLVTDQGKTMEAAVARVMPDTRHRFCQRHILSRCKQKLSEPYAKHATLKADLKECVCGAETIEEFEAQWECVLNKYNLRENVWLESLYDSRQQWAWVYQKGFFFPVLLKSQRSESLNKFFKVHFNAKTPLLVFISRFEEAMALRLEKEAEADFATLYLKPNLKTPSIIERQAASIYTRAVFEVFQEEFIQSLGYHADKVEDGMILKFIVARQEDNGRCHMVTFNQSDKQAKCSCCKFEYAGVPCRHVLRIFFMVWVRSLPEEYIVKRWTMDAVGSIAPDERSVEPQLSSPESLCAWYNELCENGLAYAMRGAMLPDVYKVAKVALQKAFADVVSAKNQQMSEQQSCSRQQDMLQHRMPLPKLQAKKAPTKK